MKPELMSIEEFAEICADVLDVDIPDIVVSDEKMKDESPTTIGYMEYDKGNITIYVRSKLNYKENIYELVAHELRHIWQMENLDDFEDLYETHIKSTEIGVDNYNEQFLEIDANAFMILAFKYLLNMSNNQPMFNTPALLKRVKELEESMGLDFL